MSSRAGARFRPRWGWPCWFRRPAIAQSHVGAVERQGSRPAAGSAVSDCAATTRRAHREAEAAARAARSGRGQAGSGGARVGAGRRGGRAMGNAGICCRRTAGCPARGHLLDAGARASRCLDRSSERYAGGPAERARESAGEIAQLFARRLQGRRLRGPRRSFAAGMRAGAPLASCGTRPVARAGDLSRLRPLSRGGRCVVPGHPRHAQHACKRDVSDPSGFLAEWLSRREVEALARRLAALDPADDRIR